MMQQKQEVSLARALTLITPQTLFIICAEKLDIFLTILLPRDCNFFKHFFALICRAAKKKGLTCTVL